MDYHGIESMQAKGLSLEDRLESYPLLGSSDILVAVVYDKGSYWDSFARKKLEFYFNFKNKYDKLISKLTFILAGI